MSEHILPSPQATTAFGRTFAQHLHPGDVVLLDGHIGSGKTTFVKGIASGLGIRHPVTSPTFVLRKRYVVPKNTRGILSLNHVDAYRLSTVRELRGLLDDFLSEERGGVWCIEWAGRVRRGLAGHRTFLITLRAYNNHTRILTTRSMQ